MNIDLDLTDFRKSTEHNLRCVGNFIGGLIEYKSSGITIYETTKGTIAAYKLTNPEYICIHKDLCHVGFRVNSDDS